MADQPTFIEVQKALSGISYPASKQDLAEHARGNGVDERVLKVLEKVPDRSYSGPDEVSKAVTEVSGGK